MKILQGRQVTVAGAGALGMVAALRLADAGAAVTVCDPAPLGGNASGVAAGMLAPGFESVLDAACGDHFLELLAARDLWPGLARRIGLEDLLDRSGAVLAGFADEDGALAAAAARMEALGLAPRWMDARALRGRLPGLAATQGLFTAEDWRIEPVRALEALATAVREVGGRIVAAPLLVRDGRFDLKGDAVEGAVVIATGADVGALSALAPELAVLSPVKGQILRFEAGPTGGPVVRSFGGYIAPQPGGALAGATMEAGRRDLDLDAAVLDRLRTEAARLFPHLAAATAQGRAGVRAATPDGLPLVGRSAGTGAVEVVLCTGARRNGWLLAPLTAEVVLRTLAGEAAPADRAFDPGRFA